MAEPAGGTPALILTGDMVFVAGGLPVDDLTGAFIKSISTAGVATVQMPDGSESDGYVESGFRCTRQRARHFRVPLR